MEKEEEDNDSVSSSESELSGDPNGTTNVNDPVISDIGAFYSEFEVKDSARSCDYFIAGRGGETNFHTGNRQIRALILNHLPQYLQAKSLRGKAYCWYVLQQPEFGSIKFVVRKGYFEKNRSLAKISKDRIASVLAEHRPETLELLPDTAYISIGSGWTVGIVQDLLREAARKEQNQDAIRDPVAAARSKQEKQELLLHQIQLPAKPTPPPAPVQALQDPNKNTTTTARYTTVPQNALFLPTSQPSYCYKSPPLAEQEQQEQKQTKQKQQLPTPSDLPDIQQEQLQSHKRQKQQHGQDAMGRKKPWDYAALFPDDPLSDHNSSQQDGRHLQYPPINEVRSSSLLGQNEDDKEHDITTGTPLS